MFPLDRLIFTHVGIEICRQTFNYLETDYHYDNIHAAICSRPSNYRQ